MGFRVTKGDNMCLCSYRLSLSHLKVVNHGEPELHGVSTSLVQDRVGHGVQDHVGHAWGTQKLGNPKVGEPKSNSLVAEHVRGSERSGELFRVESVTKIPFY